MLQELRQIDPKLPVIVMTTHGTADTAIEAMQRGAFDYVLKPWDLDELTDLVDKVLAAGRLSQCEARSSRRPTAMTVSTRSSAVRLPMQNVFKEIGRIAAQNVTVLILGRKWHRQGARRTSDLRLQSC